MQMFWIQPKAGQGQFGTTRPCRNSSMTSISGQLEVHNPIQSIFLLSGFMPRSEQHHFQPAFLLIV